MTLGVTVLRMALLVCCVDYNSVWSQPGGGWGMKNQVHMDGIKMRQEEYMISEKRQVGLVA